MIAFRTSAALVLAGALAVSPGHAVAQDPPPFELLPYGGYDDLYNYDDYIEPQEEATIPLEEVAPDTRAQLSELYRSLSEAPDARSARDIVQNIEKLWLDSGSDTIDLLMSRASTMVEAKELEVALTLLDAVIEIDPHFPEGWNQRAAVHFLQDDFSSSLRDLRYALRLDPRHFKAIGNLARIFQELGEKEAALDAYRKALDVHPHLDGARQAVRDLIREVEGQGI